MENEELTNKENNISDVAKQTVVNVLKDAINAISTPEKSKSEPFGTFVEDTFIDFVVTAYAINQRKRVFLSKEFNFVDNPIDAIGFKDKDDGMTYVTRIKKFYSDEYENPTILYRTRKCSLNEVGYGE